MKNLENLFAGASLVALLKIFVLNPQGSYYQRELERLSGVRLSQVQRELERLTAMGLIAQTVNGNRKYYRLNQACPIYPELRSILLKTLLPQNLLAESLGGIKAEIRLAFIYGSYARGEEKADSDLDLMIVGSLSLKEVSRRLAPLKKSLNREINPALYSPEEFRQKIREGNHFLTAVLREPKIYLLGGEDELKQILG